MESWDVRSLEIEVHQPQVLRSDEETRAIAILLPAGEQLQEHQVHERAYLFVADGEIEISADGRTIEGGAGLVTHFEPAERHAEVGTLVDLMLLELLAGWEQDRDRAGLLVAAQHLRLVDLDLQRRDVPGLHRGLLSRVSVSRG